MTTFHLTLEDQLADWLNTHSQSLGQSPEDLIRDLLIRRQKLSSFQAVAEKLHERSQRAGIKNEEEIIQTSLRPKNGD